MLCFTLLLIAAVGSTHGRASGNGEFKPKVEELSASFRNSSDLTGWVAVNITKYPFAVHIATDTNVISSGVLITRQHVLAPAHAFTTNGVVDANVTRYVRMGTNEYNTGNTTLVKQIVVHEQYNSTSRDNDVAVLLLVTPVEVGPTVGTISLPVSGSVIAVNTSLVAVGWGRPIVPPPANTVLYEMPATKLNTTECTAATNSSVSNAMCARITGEEVMSCLSDGGGHLVHNNVVVGMTTLFTCEEYTKPRYFTRISNYTKWIENTVSKMKSSAFSERAGMLTLLIPLIYVVFHV